MALRRLTLNVFSVLASLASIPLAGADSGDAPIPPHANHIFNAIHSSMRQWGSSLNHNGMSFFLATVPEGTQFYHGTSASQPVNGTEWLAFEPEHAMGFARPRGRGPPGGKKPGWERPPRDRDTVQQPLERVAYDQSDGSGKAGYLHTYAAARDLRLLYLDGMSAAKSSIGTLDSQDRILLNDSVDLSGAARAPGGPPGERERAILACEMAKDVWDDRIDGILRMEAGFEIILCAFERDLEVVRITQAKGSVERASRQSEQEPGQQQTRRMKAKAGGGGHNNWLKAIAARYHGIGGRRVTLNFDHFVTAYTYGLDLFPGDVELPRLNHLPTEELEPLRQSVHDLVMNYDPSRLSFDWQAITDMIVIRYSDELQTLASGNFTSTQSLREGLEEILRPFIDYSDYDSNAGDAIADRCTDQFIPQYTPNDTLASQAVRSVARTICSTMASAMLDTDLDLESAVSSFQELISYLSWTTWKECWGCDYDQLCFIPMWPMGTIEDYEHPRCRDPDGPGQPGKSYWGDFGRGPHPPPDEL